MNTHSPLYGLIGKKLTHSFSKRYFTEKFEKEGISASYELFELENAKTFPYLFDQYPSLVGLNVTIPFKLEVIPLLSELTPEARAVGAVNTIRKDKKGFIGFNSDIYGFWESLSTFLDGTQVKHALILGTGGAAKAVVYVLENLLQVESWTAVSRSPNAHQLSYEELTEIDLSAYQLIINTTPLGMYPNVSQAPLFPYERLTGRHFVYDLIYNPEITRFMQLAQNQGAKVINGLPMLIGQAEKSWAFWNRQL